MNHSIDNSDNEEICSHCELESRLAELEERLRELTREQQRWELQQRQRELGNLQRPFGYYTWMELALFAVGVLVLLAMAVVHTDMLGILEQVTDAKRHLDDLQRCLSAVIGARNDANNATVSLLWQRREEF